MMRPHHSLALLALLGGCAVGPDYKRPPLPASSGYAPTPLPSATPSQEQRFDSTRDIQADWWTLFRSPKLDALIAQALAASPDLTAAEAALRQAQENVAAQRGYFYPTIGASYMPQRTRIAGNLGGNSPGIQGNGEVISTYEGTPASEGGTPPYTRGVTYSFHTAQLTVGYTPDIFGANRRKVESLQAQSRAQALQLEAARLTLVTNIVAAAIQDGQLREQIALTETMITDQEVAAAIAAKQHRLGYISQVDRAVQDSALAEARKLLPPLRKQFEQNRNLMRALAGQPQDTEVAAFTLADFQLPQDLPLSLPSKLVEQRPDVRMAEERLHAATAGFGAARADLLPQVTLTGDVGGTASKFGQMFWNSGTFFDVFLTLTQSLFNGGTLKHQTRAARAAMEQSAAEYRATAITAFQDVANTLQAIHADAGAFTAAQDAAGSTGTSLTLVRRQHASGYLDRIALIAAEQSHRQALLDVAQARATRLGDTAALFQALGGGWWNRSDVRPSG
ncbi:MAG TPA: efflux transporter outer membrane subunit [Sphingobium sp.]|uniref:efflux transporter outer membrane subunit n=1 Tax=Sphingobium sp. TaxID=1912891 RepID=UPI002ED5D934